MLWQAIDSHQHSCEETSPRPDAGLYINLICSWEHLVEWRDSCFQLRIHPAAVKGQMVLPAQLPWALSSSSGCSGYLMLLFVAVLHIFKGGIHHCSRVLRDTKWKYRWNTLIALRDNRAGIILHHNWVVHWNSVIKSAKECQENHLTVVILNTCMTACTREGLW